MDDGCLVSSADAGLSASPEAQVVSDSLLSDVKNLIGCFRSRVQVQVRLLSVLHTKQFQSQKPGLIHRAVDLVCLSGSTIRVHLNPGEVKTMTVEL